MQRFSVLHIPFSPNDRKQTVFIHHSENGFGIVMDSVSLEPDMHSPVAIGAFAFCLALTNLIGQGEILCRYLHSFYIPIVAAA